MIWLVRTGSHCLAPLSVPHQMARKQQYIPLTLSFCPVLFLHPLQKSYFIFLLFLQINHYYTHHLKNKGTSQLL